MRYHEFSETMNTFGSNTSFMAKRFEYIASMLDDFTLTGHMSGWDVYRKDGLKTNEEIFLITDENTPIAYIVTEKQNDILIVREAFAVPESRKNGLLSGFLLWLREQRNATKLSFGTHHSRDMIEFIKRVAGHYNANWINGDKKEQYDSNNIEKYYNPMKPTGWELILESSIKWNVNQYRTNVPLPDLTYLYEMAMYDNWLEMQTELDLKKNIS